MCDYSLQNVQSRPAAVGDKLVTYKFPFGTAGFAESIKSDGCVPSRQMAAVAVCVLPGTEIAFTDPVAILEAPGESYMRVFKQTPHKVARFRQINKDNPNTHHDALELPDGTLVLLNHVVENQSATVLQLPAKPKNKVEADEQRRVEFAG